MIPPPPHALPLSPQSAAQKAVAAVGCGFDLTHDLRLSRCKQGPAGSRLIDLDQGDSRHDLVVPGGIVVEGVPSCIRCDKGERTRFRSDVISFHQMSEHFNLELALSGKIPSGIFNSMFQFRGCWRADASSTKKLAFDGWFITLYSVEISKSHILLQENIKNEVPSSWNPAALAEFIDKYGTHVITGVRMGGKDVFYLKQLPNSTLQPGEVQTLLKKMADENFKESKDIRPNLDSSELRRELMEHRGVFFNSIGPPIVSHSRKEDVVSIHIRRGGYDYHQSHGQWLSTISMAPDVISMSFVPISSILSGVPGSGFLAHALNLYLRYKPQIEDLQQFLEFQLPRQWSPLYNELPLGPQHKIQKFPCLQFTFMGPKLSINTKQVNSGNRPITGIRLFLEGKRSDCLAIHLQHLSALPDNLQIFEDISYASHKDESQNKAYYEPVRWSIFSHICTAPINYNGSLVGDSAAIMTKARLEVMDIDLKKVLFLRLGFSSVASARIRRSEWEGPSSASRKSGSISSFISSRFSSGIPEANNPPPKVEVNSAVFPDGPPVPFRIPKMSRYINTTETTRGPEDLPGCWVVTGAKLALEGGKISVKAKYSLLSILSEDEL